MDEIDALKAHLSGVYTGEKIVDTYAGNGDLKR
jgi:hypothetical protein